MRKITREQILMSAQNYCKQYGVDFAAVIAEHGGEDSFVAEVAELDATATHVINFDSTGERYTCKAIWRLDCPPSYNLVKWAYDKGYASYNSAEIVCRGGYATDTSDTRYDVEGDVIEHVEYIL